MVRIFRGWGKISVEKNILKLDSLLGFLGLSSYTSETVEPVLISIS